MARAANPKADADRWRGIHQHGPNLRAVVSRGRGVPPVRKIFPKGTPLEAIQEWREDVRAELRLGRKQRARLGGFADDAKRYLRDSGVQALTTFKQRAKHIALWSIELGDVPRADITAGMIRAVRDRWKSEPGRGKTGGPLAAATINKRLNALSNVWTVLDGSRAPNPCHDVEDLPTPEAKPRAQSYDVIEQILAAVPDLGRSVKGQRRQSGSATRVRLRCFAYSPITPIQMKQLRPQDIDLKRGRLRLPERAKGAGAAAAWIPLPPQGIAAFRDFDRMKLYGKFAHDAVGVSFRRAARRVGVSMRLYDLRHSYLTFVFRTTGNRQAVSEHGQHASWSTSERYTIEAQDDVRAHNAAPVIEAFAQRLSGRR